MLAQLRLIALFLFSLECLTFAFCVWTLPIPIEQRPQCTRIVAAHLKMLYKPNEVVGVVGQIRVVARNGTIEQKAKSLVQR